MPDPSDTTDPFDTAARRAAVLASWSEVTTRFREDANAEEELVGGGLGGYADRLVVELAQNASDAAARAGVPGRLRFTFADGVLSVANTGAPLDAAGVDGLTSLRASAKTKTQFDDARFDGAQPAIVGRFGVGFAAVLAVSDEPEVRSRDGGVRFSAELTRAEVEALGGTPAKELRRRKGGVPVLRLVWPVEGAPPDGYDTEVRLPVRPEALDRVRELLAAVEPTLLFAFPGLTGIEIDGRVLTREGDTLIDSGVATRWQVARRTGEVPPELLEGRPLEERMALAGFQTLAAVPLGGDPLVTPQVLHAPTPTDEQLSLPLHLSATFPLEVSRRRVAAGPLTDWLTARLADTVVDLVLALPPTPAIAPLVPNPGIGLTPLDAALCSVTLAALRESAVLPVEPVPVEGDDAALDVEIENVHLLDVDGPGSTTERAATADRIFPRDAATFDRDLRYVARPLVEALAGVVPGLLPADWADARASQALAALGVRRLRLVDLVEAVTGLNRPPAWWQRLYAALAQVTSAGDDDALAALPVPLTDGRTVTGARGALLPGSDLAALDPSLLAPLDLRVVHPDAVEESLLERLGAQPATAETILDGPLVRGAVADSLDADDPEPLAEAVLALVAVAGGGSRAWLAELALPADDGDWAPAGELVVPGTPLVTVLEGMGGDDPPFGVVDADFAADHGADALAAVGCLTTFTVLEADDLDLVDLLDLDAEDADLDLDNLEGWAEAVIATIDPTGTVGAPPGTRIERFRAVRDLDLVDPAQWPTALALLAVGTPREVLAGVAIAVTPDGRRIEVPAYTRWWLASEPVLGDRPPGDLRTPEALDLDGLYDPAPAGYDAAFLALLGCRTGLLDALAADPVDLLDRLADPDRTAVAWVVPLIYARIAEALAGARVPPPARVRVAPDAVAETDRVAILDQPWRLSALEGRAPVLGGDDPVSVAELLDAPLVSEL